MDRLLNMILNIFLRRAVNTGFNKGISHFARKGKPAAQMTPEERAQAAKGRELQKPARPPGSRGVWGADPQKSAGIHTMCRLLRGICRGETAVHTGILKCFDSFNPCPW